MTFGYQGLKGTSDNISQDATEKHISSRACRKEGRDYWEGGWVRGLAEGRSRLYTEPFLKASVRMLGRGCRAGKWG